MSIQNYAIFHSIFLFAFPKVNLCSRCCLCFVLICLTTNNEKTRLRLCQILLFIYIFIFEYLRAFSYSESIENEKQNKMLSKQEINLNIHMLYRGIMRTFIFCSNHYFIIQSRNKRKNKSRETLRYTYYIHK